MNNTHRSNVDWKKAAFVSAAILALGAAGVVLVKSRRRHARPSDEHKVPAESEEHGHDGPIPSHLTGLLCSEEMQNESKDWPVLRSSGALLKYRKSPCWELLEENAVHDDTYILKLVPTEHINSFYHPQRIEIIVTNEEECPSVETLLDKLSSTLQEFQLQSSEAVKIFASAEEPERLFDALIVEYTYRDSSQFMMPLCRALGAMCAIENRYYFFAHYILGGQKNARRLEGSELDELRAMIQSIALEQPRVTAGRLMFENAKPAFSITLPSLDFSALHEQYNPPSAKEHQLETVVATFMAHKQGIKISTLSCEAQRGSADMDNVVQLKKKGKTAILPLPINEDDERCIDAFSYKKTMGDGVVLEYLEAFMRINDEDVVNVTAFWPADLHRYKQRNIECIKSITDLPKPKKKSTIQYRCHDPHLAFAVPYGTSIREMSLPEGGFYLRLTDEDNERDGCFTTVKWWTPNRDISVDDLHLLMEQNATAEELTEDGMTSSESTIVELENCSLRAVSTRYDRDDMVIMVTSLVHNGVLYQLTSTIPTDQYDNQLSTLKQIHDTFWLPNDDDEDS